MPNETKRPAEGKSVPPMMKRMMEKCCTGELDPRAVCEEMMASMGNARDTSGWTMPDCCRPRARGAAPEGHEE